MCTLCGQGARGAMKEDTPTGNTSVSNGAQPPGEYLRIEQVSERTGLTKRTLRYYEEIGLLEPPSRTEGGYRLYSQEDIQRLLRIKRLRDLIGLSLAEIREYVGIEEQRDLVRAAWQRDTNPRARLAWLERSEELLREQLRLIEEKLAGLEEMRASVRERLETHAHTRAELQAAAATEESSSS
jgi:MerR family transcriptional regulator, repressor of the yfmOP operon